MPSTNLRRVTMRLLSLKWRASQARFFWQTARRVREFLRPFVGARQHCIDAVWRRPTRPLPAHASNLASAQRAAAAAGARCGVVYVPENHAKPRGRKIGLNVLVLPATGKADASRAQYDLEGGPGFAATDFLDFYAGDGAMYRESRDIVLADMRGTGGSNPLRCFGIEEREKRQPLAPMYPPELVAECAPSRAWPAIPRSTPPPPRRAISSGCARRWATSNSISMPFPTARRWRCAISLTIQSACVRRC